MASKAKGKSNKKTLVLLDVHAILHRAYHALPDFSSSKGEPTGALYGVCAMLIKIIDDIKPDYIAACYDLPEPTYRHELYEDYKGGRGKTDDELIAQIERSRSIFEAFNIPMYDHVGFEADDMLGTIVEQVKDNKDLDVMIASGDMDTLQLVVGDKVRVYTLKKGIKDTIIYNEKGVIERYGFKPKMLVDFKGLRGDPSDNIIGIPGIGEKTGTILIQAFGTIEEMYKKLKKDEAAFEKAGIKPRIVGLLKEYEEEALFSKELATIRRDSPITYVLPTKVWREEVSVDTVIDLFREFEFRTLGARFRDVMGIRETVVEEEHDTTITDEKAFREAALGLWILDSNQTNPTVDDLLQYTGKKNVADAMQVIDVELKKRKLLHILDDMEKPLIPIVNRMQERGIAIDVKYFAKLSKEYHKEIDILEQKIWKFAGEEFNIASPKQLGVILFEKLELKALRQKKTASGNYSTKESELEKIKDQHEIVPLIFEYRELAKLLGTYIDAIPKLVAEDGRLHAQFIQAGTTTGRMASKDPNLQNIPNKTAYGRRIRNGFVAAKGFKLVAIDYSQIELRIAAFLSEDKKLMEIFKNGEDVHTAVASEVFGVKDSEITKDMRRQAKVINFGIIYGMGVNSLKSALGADRKTAQEFYNRYFEKFNILAKYLEDVKADTARKGYTETLFGRRRYFEGIKSHLPFIRAAAERMAINAPIQGTEADIVKIAMIEVEKYLEKEGLLNKVYILLQVHDELVFEIEESIVDKVIPEIEKIMEGVVTMEQTKDVPILVDSSVGDNWGEMERVDSK
ncbi:hypothetical protein COB55_02980 [Candidatus Wolfebacteria bacterium]|nr:MAG: hypothetical protein COB55_02980 [Candidatus Wolfebacteria bacterium]